MLILNHHLFEHNTFEQRNVDTADTDFSFKSV